MHLKDWQPPWPPIYLGDDQWVVMRDSKREPAAIVRALRFGPRNELYYRVVLWAAASDQRTLVGYFPDLESADRSVLFAPKLPGNTLQPPRFEKPPTLEGARQPDVAAAAPSLPLDPIERRSDDAVRDRSRSSPSR